MVREYGDGPPFEAFVPYALRSGEKGSCRLERPRLVVLANDRSSSSGIVQKMVATVQIYKIFQWQYISRQEKRKNMPAFGKNQNRRHHK